MLYIIVCDAIVRTNSGDEFLFDDFLIRDDSINHEGVLSAAQRRVGKKRNITYVKLKFKSCVGIITKEINMPDQEFEFDSVKKKPATKQEKKEDMVQKETREDRLRKIDELFQ